MLLYLILLKVIYFSSAQTKANRKVGDFDELLFVQSSAVVGFYKLQHVWPTRSTTSRNSHISEGAIRALRKPDRWVIHGLWPHKIRGKSPTVCRNNTFDGTLINATLSEKLEEEWPSFIPDKLAIGLWHFQWNKHGSCTTNISFLDTIPKYFNKILKLINEYNIGPILGKQDIRPGGKYSLKNIYNTLKNNLSNEIIIRCLIDQHTGEQYLSEVEICLDKTFMTIYNCEHHGFMGCNLRRSAIYGNVLSI